MKIAIVKLSAFGDIVHAMVVLQFIKKYNQAIEIDWLVEESYKELLVNNPDINKVIVINLKKVKEKKSILLLINELKNARELGPYDMVIDIQGLVKSALISRLIRSSLTIGFDRSSVRESIASIFYNKTYKYSYDKNVIERNLSLVNFALDLNYSKKDAHHKLPFLHSNSKYLIPKFSNIKKNILLIPGASFKSKCYPPTKFSELTKALDANFFILSGNSEEKELAMKIKIQSPNVNVLEKLSLNSLISLISQVDLVIGSDTGPTHMAWALCIPSITLFGPTPGKRNTFVTNINRFLESDSKVNPYKINKNDFSIKNIKVTDIVKISHELLD